jgi:hypothetical protein
LRLRRCAGDSVSGCFTRRWPLEIWSVKISHVRNDEGGLFPTSSTAVVRRAGQAPQRRRPAASLTSLSIALSLSDHA